MTISQLAFPIGLLYLNTTPRPPKMSCLLQCSVCRSFSLLQCLTHGSCVILCYPTALCHPMSSHHSVSSHVIPPLLPSSRRSCVRPSSLSPDLGWPVPCSAGLSALSYAIHYSGFFPYAIFTAELSTPTLSAPRFRISLDPAGPRICVTWCLPVWCPAPGQSL